MSIIVLFVETPRKFITVNLLLVEFTKFITLLFITVYLLFIIAVTNLRGVSTNKTIIYLIAMQTYKELIMSV